MKACVGTEQPYQSNEVRILNQIHKNGRGTPGYNNIIEVYDIFTIRGPNGFHEFLVTEAVVTLSESGRRQRSPPQKVIQQILSGFAFLHREGLVHGGNTQHFWLLTKVEGLTI